MLSALAALGFDTGQIVHSVLSNACDCSGALWWILWKKVGKGSELQEERTSSTAPVADPFSDSALSGKVAFEGAVSEEEGEGALAINGVRPAVLLEDVDESKKKRKPNQEREHLKEAPVSAPDQPSVTRTPEFAIVPATPIATEEVAFLFTIRL